jgi:hypothetical protein
MSQLIINVGTVSNDGTGDTIRGAFVNVNTNFTEVYNHIANLTANVASIDVIQNVVIGAAFNTANAAFDYANTVNTLTYNVGTSANLYSVSVGVAGNSFTTTVGASSNAYTNAVGTAVNAYAQFVGNSGNSYATILSTNNSASANAWANTIQITTLEWANAKFESVSNVGVVFTHANNAFIKANNSLQNTSITIQGNVTTLGVFSDQYAPIRDKLAFVVNSNVSMIYITSLVLANNSNNIYINIEEDTKFPSYANVGTTIEVFQVGTGTTTFVANDAAVTVNGPNNCLTMGNQYTVAKLVKLAANNWFVTGDLRA